MGVEEVEDFGGVGEVDSYFKSGRPSPCASCGRLEHDKEGCSLICARLDAWQRSERVVPFHFSVTPPRKAGGNGQKRCAEDGHPLRFDDGVIYCEHCLAVYMRFVKGGAAKQVAHLLAEGWDVDCIAEMLDVGVVQVMALARSKGYRFQAYNTEDERRVIVEYALLHSPKEAAAEFGLHRDTVNRYCREMGFGKAERYRHLRDIAEVMFRDGKTVAQVCRKLGVARRTATKWLKKMCT